MWKSKAGINSKGVDKTIKACCKVTKLKTVWGPNAQSVRIRQEKEKKERNPLGSNKFSSLRTSAGNKYKITRV